MLRVQIQVKLSTRILYQRKLSIGQERVQKVSLPRTGQYKPIMA